MDLYRPACIVVTQRTNKDDKCLSMGVFSCPLLHLVSTFFATLQKNRQLVALEEHLF